MPLTNQVSTQLHYIGSAGLVYLISADSFTRDTLLQTLPHNLLNSDRITLPEIVTSAHQDPDLLVELII